MAKLLGEALASAYRQIADNLDAGEGGLRDTRPAPATNLVAECAGEDRSTRPTDAGGAKVKLPPRPMGMGKGAEAEAPASREEVKKQGSSRMGRYSANLPTIGRDMATAPQASRGDCPRQRSAVVISLAVERAKRGHASALDLREAL